MSDIQVGDLVLGRSWRSRGLYRVARLTPKRLYVEKEAAVSSSVRLPGAVEVHGFDDKQFIKLTERYGSPATVLVVSEETFSKAVNIAKPRYDRIAQMASDLQSEKDRTRDELLALLGDPVTPETEPPQ